MQTWFVEKIAESLWRLRRGTRAERGSSLVTLWDAPPYQKESLWSGLAATLAVEQSLLTVLNAAWEEMQQTGTLSAATYAKVGSLVAGQGQTAVKTPGTEKAKESNPTIDDDFRRRLEERRFLLQISVRSHSSQLNDGTANAIAKSALPAAPEVDKILRYENQMRKQLDWAFKGFYKCQKRRPSRPKV